MLPGMIFEHVIFGLVVLCATCSILLICAASWAEGQGHMMPVVAHDVLVHRRLTARMRLWPTWLMSGHQHACAHCRAGSLHTREAASVCACLPTVPLGT